MVSSEPSFRGSLASAIISFSLNLSREAQLATSSRSTLSGFRTDRRICCAAPGVREVCGHSIPLLVKSYSHFIPSRADGYVCVPRGSATSAGILFRSWNAGGEGSAAIVFDWERGVLEAIFEGAGADLGAAEALDPEDESTRRVGGPTEHVGDEDVHLRVLLDGSALEVYIGSGEVLSTRIYRCAGLACIIGFGCGEGQKGQKVLPMRNI